MSKLKLQVKDKQGKIRNNGSIEIKNQTETSAELFFYGDIASESWQSDYYEEDKCPKDVKDFLDQLENVSNIDVHMNSGGGSVFGGIAIYNLLKRYDASITVHIDGIAASIASVIACAGDKVIIPNNATFMIHKPLNCYFFTSMNADDLRKDAEVLDTCQKSIVSIYMNKVKEGITEQQINELMNKETWLTGSDVQDYFDFEIENSNEAVACTSIYFDKYMNTPQNLIRNESKPNQSQNSIDEAIISKIVDEKLKSLKNTEKENFKNGLLRDLDQYGQ